LDKVILPSGLKNRTIHVVHQVRKATSSQRPFQQKERIPLVLTIVYKTS
jgi:hypothetical protein